jgi:hypothetical protein
MTPSGIEPATFRLVAQYLNHCATAVPPVQMYTLENASSCYKAYTTSMAGSTSGDGFGGLVVRMLPSGSRVRGFKPGRIRWIFLYIKILSMPTFGGKLNNLSHVPTLRHVKDPRICSELRLAS